MLTRREAIALAGCAPVWLGSPLAPAQSPVSKFSDASEFMGTEFLNLAARRNLLYRVLDPSRASSDGLAGLGAAIYLDAEKPNAPRWMRRAAYQWVSDPSGRL